MSALLSEICPKCFQESAIPVEDSKELVLCTECQNFSTGIDFIAFSERKDYVTSKGNRSIKTLEVGSDWSIVFHGANYRTIFFYVLLSIGFLAGGAAAIFTGIDAYREGQGITPLLLLNMFGGIFIILGLGFVQYTFNQLFGFTRITAFGNRLEIYHSGVTPDDSISYIRNRIVDANYHQGSDEWWHTLQVKLFNSRDNSTNVVDLIDNSTGRDDHQEFLMEFLHKKIKQDNTAFNSSKK